MVDILALSVAHAALLVALWRLVGRADLDREAEGNRTGNRAGRGKPRA